MKLKKIKRAWRNATSFISVILISTLIVFSLLVLIQFINSQYYTHQYQNKITDSYLYNQENHYYYLDLSEDDIVDSNRVISTVNNNIPDHLIDTLISDIVIYISPSNPFQTKNNSRISGTSLTEYGVLWLNTNLDESTYAHEIGHMFDAYMGYASNTKEFVDIYKNYRQDYLEYGRENIDIHSVCDEKEFFASLFADYIVHREYVKENCLPGYQYFEDLLSDYWKYDTLGRFCMCFTRVFYKSKDLIESYRPRSNIELKYQNSIKIASEESLQVDPVKISYQEYDPNTVYIINKIFDYLNDSTESNASFDMNTSIDMNVYLEVKSFAALYFLDPDLDPVNITTSSTITHIDIRTEDILMANKQRKEYEFEAMNYITSHLKDTNERDILIQIAYYISQERNSAFENATKFKLYASLLGFESNVLYIEDINLNYHFYNRIKLSNGSYVYYDITYGIIDYDEIIYDQGYYIDRIFGMV